MSRSTLAENASAGTAGEATAERRALAGRILIDAALLGALGDALLHDGFGLGFFAWMLALSATVLQLVRRRGARLSREQAGWLVTALFFASGFVWRDSSALTVYDFLATVLALALLAVTFSQASPVRTILGQRVRDLMQALARVVGAGCVAVVRAFLASGLTETDGAWRGERTKGAIRALLIALPVLLFFGALLTSADPLFGSLFSLPGIDLGEVLSHVVLAAAIAWIVGGSLYFAVLDDRRVSRVRDGMPITLGSLDVTIILGGLVVLFALFVGVQIGWLFGGERLVRSTTGLGYAQYARHGFFELVWVSLLILPVLLGTRAAIREGDATAVRRHRMLALPLLVLVGGVMASALGRMQLYVHYYGLSMDRLSATVFMGWLAIVFVWFGLTVLRGRTHDFAAGMTITGFVTLAALNLTNPEALVARVNVARAGTALRLADSTAVNDRNAPSGQRTVEAPVDYWYLTTQLDGDAVGEVANGLVAAPVSAVDAPSRVPEVKARCEAVRRLFLRWGPKASDHDWRLWSLGGWRASRAVRANERALRAVTCWDAQGEMPFGDRDQRPARPGEQDYKEPAAR